MSVSEVVEVPNVLVVEDDVDIRSLVSARLRGAGHRVLVAGSGAEAEAVVGDRGAPDAVVLDVGLPGSDGFDVLTRLRAATSAPALPAVFLTARIQEPDIARGRAMGAQYLTKPFVATALITAVNRALAAPVAEEGGW